MNSIRSLHPRHRGVFEPPLGRTAVVDDISVEPPFDSSRTARRPPRVPRSAVASFAILGALSWATLTWSAPPVSLGKAIDLALEQNPNLLATRQQREIANGQMVRASYWNRFNPVIAGGVGQREFNEGGSDSQFSGSLSLQVEVAGQRGKRIEVAEQNLARVDAEIRDFERLLVADVKEAFYRSLYLDRRADLFRRIEKLNRRLRDASDKRYRSGEVAKLEANLAEIRYSQSRKDTLGAERDHRNALRGLERLLGVTPTGSIALAGDLTAMPDEIDVASAISSALASRPDLEARSAEIARVDAETSLTKRLIVPNVTVGAFYDEETEVPGITDRILGGQISIPIPIFDRKQAELTSLAGQRTQARYDRSAVELTVRTEVRDAARSFEAASEAVRVFEADAVGRIAENFGFIETSYREGKIDLLQLIVVQNDMVATERSYLDSLWDYWLARIALERAVGQPLEQGARP